jgi:UDP:flavonoid glycosyltransferase YjiC (YdhE family)
MTFLIVTLGSIGDLLPFLAVAQGLRDRGHRVIFASNAGYEQLIKGAGFDFAAIWDRAVAQEALDASLHSDPLRAWQTVKREMFEPATGPTYDFVAHFARREKCVVLASWSAFGARLAHEKLGVPLCTAYLSPHAIEEDVRAAGDHRIGLFADWFCPTPSHASADVRMTGFAMFEDQLVPALPPEVESFLNDGPPPVIFTPGSFIRQSRDFFRQSLEACAAIGARGLFLTPHRDQIPEHLPPTVRHFSYLALQRLAPKSAALVYHGGIGTCVQAMKAGIPHLVMPMFFDQFDNAARISALGIGSSVERYTGAAVAAKLGELLQSQSVAQSCRRVSMLFEGKNAVAETCAIVETLDRA